VSYTVLARKWRPKNFSELVGQSHVMQALSNALDSQRLHHAYLFTGTRGVGKTTIARIFAKALNCEQGISSTPCGVCSVCQSINEGRFVDLIEIDAASRTKVEDTREILDNVQYAPTQGRYKVYLIDEVHMLSKSSFNALLKTLEEPPAHVKFLLATTDPHKLPITVLSRCLQFNLLRLTSVQIQQHLAMILQQEGVEFEQNALALIAKSADGSARDALSLLDQAIAYCGGTVRFDAVQSMLGLVDQGMVQAVLLALAEDSAEQVKQIVQTLSSLGVNYTALLNQLLETLHQITQCQILGEVLDEGGLPAEVLTEFAQKLTPDQVQLYYQIGLLARQDMSLAPDIRIGFEMTLLRMLAFKPQTPYPDGHKGLAVNHEPAKPVQNQIDQAPAAPAQNMTALLKQVQQRTTSVKEEVVKQVTPRAAPESNRPPVDLSLFPDLAARMGGKAQPPASELAMTHEPVKQIDVISDVQPAPLNNEPAFPVYNPTIGSAAPQIEDKPEIKAPEPIEVWCQIIDSIKPEGMALELARRSILMAYNDQAWWLSVSPQHEMAKSEIAQNRLLEAARAHYGQGFVIHYVNYAGDFYTPDDFEKDQQRQQAQDAVQAIKQDPMSQQIQDVLAMQLLEKTIQPI
jgi:DNA polymerase III subunit gamma/tau